MKLDSHELNHNSLSFLLRWPLPAVSHKKKNNLKSDINESVILFFNLSIFKILENLEIIVPKYPFTFTVLYFLKQNKA